MIYPPHLKPGDTIGIFSPSYPATAIAPKRTQTAINFLEQKGYKILKGSLTGKNDFYRSGTIKERVNELNELIENPEVKCIMAVLGGMVSNSMLPYINYEQLKKTPKIITGYSDVTALLFGIYSMTGMIHFAKTSDEIYNYLSRLLYSTVKSYDGLQFSLLINIM